MLLVLLLAVGLFGERYGINLARYHTPLPDCSQVLSIGQCNQYGPWARDYQLKQSKVASSGNLPTFTHAWFYGMWFRSFFAADCPGTSFQTRRPLDVPGMTAIVISVASLAAVAIKFRTLFQKYDKAILGLFLLVSVTFVGALWLNNYMIYLDTGKAVAVNGRYLFPVLPLLILVSALAWMEVIKSQALRALFATALLVCLLWGGGAMTYILRSNDAWYWPNQYVRTINGNVRNFVGPVTPGYRHLY